MNSSSYGFGSVAPKKPIINPEGEFSSNFPFPEIWSYSIDQAIFALGGLGIDISSTVEQQKIIDRYK